MRDLKAFVTGLAARGIRLTATGDRLRVQGPAPALTPELYQQLTNWKDALLDYVSEQDDWGQPVAAPRPAMPPARSAMSEAAFGRGIRVQIRPETPNRYRIWLATPVGWTRRKDFASPSLDHSKRTAERWYGKPVESWAEVYER